MTKLIFKDEKTNVEIDITDTNAVELIRQIKNIMLFQEYHPMSIQRALNEVSEELEELFDTIKPSKETEDEI